MGLSVIEVQRDIILQAIRDSPAGRNAGGWKVLVVDEDSKRLIDNVVREDDILEKKVTNIDLIEARRQRNPDTDALYILTPEPHVIDCLLADLEQRRYGGYFILWTSILSPGLRDRLTRSRTAQNLGINYSVLNIDFDPRESHLVTFRDPHSFPILFHPACSNLVKQHISDLAQRIAAVCIALGEHPTIRFYQPRDATHEAAVLCQHVANAVENELETYAQWNPDFSQPGTRPKAALYIVDRSMDLFAPFVHEFTYQAMAHDLLPIQEGNKPTFRVTINEGKPNEERKDMEISDKDRVWVEYRHLHMKDTIEKLMADFQSFIDSNPHFANSEEPANLNTIKDMLAGLPQFQEMKEAYSLHLTMAQDCMNIFQEHKLPDLAGLEQTLATGLDEDYRKPKNLGDQLVRMLDEPAIVQPDRLRLIILYVLFKYGVLPADIKKLLLHANIPLQEEALLYNLEILGARISKPLKDAKPQPPPLFPRKPPPVGTEEEISISRFDTALKNMLDAHISGSLDASSFPYVRRDQAPQPNDMSANLNSSSLRSQRSAKPTWARAKLGSVEPRQRILVFMAGGATYSEARACYEATERTSRDVVLITSHMLTPGLFLGQVNSLGMDRRSLQLPADRPAKRAPAHLFEEEGKPNPPPPTKDQSQPKRSSGLPSNPGSLRPGQRPPGGGSGGAPVDRMSAMSLNGRESPAGPQKLTKDPDGDTKKKKKHLWSRS